MLQGDLLFSGSLPLSRHCSAQGAIEAQPRVCRQTRSYLLLLYARGRHGATDWESACLLGWERTTINARRNPLCKGDRPWVTTLETRPGPTGRNKNCVWTLTIEGRRAVEDLNATEATR